MLRLCSAILVSILLFVGTTSALYAGKLKVVTSFSILADFVQVIGGEQVSVDSLVGAEEDVHIYQPRPQDAQRLANADLLVVNGLGFEGWIERLISASGYKGPVVTASDNVPLLIHVGLIDAHEHDVAGSSDPHAWQSVDNAKTYVTNIANALVAIDATHRQYYYSRLDAYHNKLDLLDAQIKQKLAVLPLQQRKVITSHNAYGYYSSAYGIRFIAAQGINSAADISAKALANLVRTITAENVKVAFFENLTNPRLLQQITHETGCRIVGQLYSDSLSRPDGPASSYLDMMRYNLETLIEAMLNPV